MAAKARRRRAPPRKQRRTLAVSAERRALEAALRLSQRANGAGGAAAVRLTGADRRLPRYMAVVGDLSAYAYRPPEGSKRARWEWEHQSGDRGAGRPKSRRRPLLVADPRTGKPYALPAGSPMRLTKRGLVG